MPALKDRQLYTLYRLLLITIAVFITANLPAQPVTAPGDLSRLLFTRKHLSVSVFFGLSGKAGVEAGPNNYQLGSSRRKAFGAGFNYHVNFSRELSLIAGVHFAAPIRNIEYRIPKEAFTPALSEDLFHNSGISETVVFLLRFPVTLEGRWFKGDRKFHYLSGGASTNLSFLNEEEETHYMYDSLNRRTQVFHMYIPEHNNGDSWVNFHIGAGWGRLLKNHDIITFGLSTNLSFTRFIRGDFDILIVGQPPVYGKYTFKGSWAGITFNYIYTGSKKKWKKLLAQEN